MKTGTVKKEVGKAGLASLARKASGATHVARADWGLKHVCPDCASKYYDLKKTVVTCPSCGAAPPAPRVPRSRAPRTARQTFWRTR